MKKRLLIICSIIGVLLAGFQFPIYAEETAPDYSSSTSIMSSTPLDQYFYDNYELLPYIESDGNQYINTSINPSNHIKTDISFAYVNEPVKNYNGIFGSRIDGSNNMYLLEVQKLSNSYILSFGNSTHLYNGNFDPYILNHISFDKNKVYLNSNLIHTFNEFDFNNIYPIYIFAVNTANAFSDNSNFLLYNFSIYDYAANEGEGALVRDYYPARSKSGGVIGLYDAVSKTFVTTSGSVPFASPTGDPTNLSLGANINQFLSGSLSWIGAIFAGINEMPIIWVFIAIALAGVMFRWARRIVHL